MEVAGVDTVRGASALHLVFRISGGALWYHIEQTLESWVGRSDFRSRRFWNRTAEKGKSWERKFDIYPDSGFYREAGRDTTVATVPDPLDDAAFLYWIRTVPLEIGKRYEYHRYFRPERNPVIVEVLGRERVGVAGRKWNAIVIRPRIPNGGGIFAERADARMWLADDDRHVTLALQSNFSVGQVTMELKAYSDPPPGRPCPGPGARFSPASSPSLSRSAPTKSTRPCSATRPAATRASPRSGVPSPTSSPRKTCATSRTRSRGPPDAGRWWCCSGVTSSRSAWGRCSGSCWGAA